MSHNDTDVISDRHTVLETDPKPIHQIKHFLQLQKPNVILTAGLVIGVIFLGIYTNVNE